MLLSCGDAGSVPEALRELRELRTLSLHNNLLTGEARFNVGNDTILLVILSLRRPPSICLGHKRHL